MLVFAVSLRYCICFQTNFENKLFFFQDSLQDLNLGHLTPQVTELAINLALDRKSLQREMTSVLISDLYGNVFNHQNIADGFDSVLRSLSELTLDAPEAPTVSIYQSSYNS